MSIPHSQTSRTRRAHARGLSLVEVLIVMAIAVFLVGGMVFASGQIQRSRLKASASRVAAAMRTGYQRASSTGRRLRLVIDFQEATIWLEESADVMLIQTGDITGTGGADPATAIEKSAMAEANRIAAGVQVPRPSFRPIDGPAGTPQQLHPNIVVHAVDSQHEAAAKTSGRAYVYFFASEAERASVQLAIKGSEDPHDIFSVVLSPLTGKATIMDGPVKVPHPRDDAEASEAEDDGR